MSNAGSSALYAVGAVALKSVGSYFRILDTTGAPSKIQQQTTLREGITLGITGITAFATQLLAPALKKLFKFKTSGQLELLRTGLVFVGYVLAESIGRLFTNATYADMAKHFQPSASSAEKVLQQITHYLWGQPSPAHTTFAHTTFSSTGPNTTINPANFGRTPNATIISSPTFYSSHPYLRNKPSAFSTTPYLT